MQIRLYVLCFRTEALVASHLTPEEFGVYMSVGTKKLSSGKVMFFEVDPALKSDWFPLDDLAARCTPHEDGSPKRSKWVSAYRVIEHVPLGAYGDLHLTTSDGRVLSLPGRPWQPEDELAGQHLYLELCPLTPLVVSRHGPRVFSQKITDPSSPINVPRLVFADLQLSRGPDGRLAGDLPYAGTEHLEECLAELERGGGKCTKTVARAPNLPAFYRSLRTGFYIGDREGTRAYRFPDRQTLEIYHGPWWRSAAGQ